MSTAMPTGTTTGIHELVTDAPLLKLGFSASTVNYTLSGISAGYPLVPPGRAPLSVVINQQRRQREQESGDRPGLEFPVSYYEPHYDEPPMGNDRGDDSPTDRGVVIIQF